jgi:hypothetical protein
VARKCYQPGPSEADGRGSTHLPLGGTTSHDCTADYCGRRTEHTTAQDAVTAMIRSGFARRLGARAASRVHWSDRARQAAHAPFRAQPGITRAKKFVT